MTEDLTSDLERAPTYGHYQVSDASGRELGWGEGWGGVVRSLDFCPDCAKRAGKSRW